MTQCGKCSGAINAEHIRVNRTPRGRVWRVRTYCAFCEMLLETRVREGTPSLFPKIITDRPTVLRFLRSSPFASKSPNEEPS